MNRGNQKQVRWHRGCTGQRVRERQFSSYSNHKYTTLGVRRGQADTVSL